MKPSEECKNAGLKSLAHLVEISGVSEQTLINWHRSKPIVFDLVLRGAVSATQKEYLGIDGKQ